MSTLDQWEDIEDQIHSCSRKNILLVEGVEVGLNVSRSLLLLPVVEGQVEVSPRINRKRGIGICFIQRMGECSGQLPVDIRGGRGYIFIIPCQQTK